MEETECESTFCEYYKPLLVEEIALVVYPAHAHFGKCLVIGTLACTSNRLESLSVPAFPTDMQLPDGACSVELCFNNFFGFIPRGKHVEITGILKLRHTDTEHVTDAANLRSTLLCLDTTVIKEEYEETCTRYKPFIEVDHIRIISHARELITCNLDIRKLYLLNQNER
uniref:Uncharacterized protein n=1 Tax=Anopheles funestus TaxID=62324 RepID=A0A4Y0BFN7_ANOFN